MELNIERRFDLPGGYCCIFFIGEQEYLASMVLVNCLPECRIFKSKDGQFSFDDALGEYVNYDMPFTEAGMRQCIEEFIEQKQNEQ